MFTPESKAPRLPRHPDASPSPVLAPFHLEQSFLFQRRIGLDPEQPDGATFVTKQSDRATFGTKQSDRATFGPKQSDKATFGPKIPEGVDSGTVQTVDGPGYGDYDFLPEPASNQGECGDELASGRAYSLDYESILDSNSYERGQSHGSKLESGRRSKYGGVSLPGGSVGYADPVDYQQSQIYDNLVEYEEVPSRITMSLGNMFCSRCGDGFEAQEKIVNSHGELWHQQCFVCAQCFRPFPGGIFYEFEGRKYCEHDFHVLFAPCCGKCGEFVIGRVIKAMNANWHPKCFRCEHCNKELADLGFIRNQNRALCHECNAQAKAVGFGKHMCHKCHGVIDDKPLKFRGEVYHPYHFNCTSCGTELNSDAREVKSRPGYTANDMNELYCLRCHDKMGIPICGACRRPIEERVVTALGKHWHVEHFVCARCEKPFLGHRHYEKKGLAYCETHYHQLFGNLCFVCNQVIGGDVFTALNKAWCVHHFACSVCDQKLNQKTKFYELDLKPTCKKCYDKFPAEMRHRLRKAFKNTPKKAN